MWNEVIHCTRGSLLLEAVHGARYKPASWWQVVAGPATAAVDAQLPLPHPGMWASCLRMERVSPFYLSIGRCSMPLVRSDNTKGIAPVLLAYLATPLQCLQRLLATRFAYVLSTMKLLPFVALLVASQSQPCRPHVEQVELNSLSCLRRCALLPTSRQCACIRCCR